MSKKERKTGKESWWGEARNNLIAQGITLLLLPISIAATYYLTRHYTAPRPEIQFISAMPVTLAVPPDSFRTRILEDPYLSQFIWKEPILLNSQVSINWLKGAGQWDDECHKTFQVLIQTLKLKVDTKYESILRWNPREEDRFDVVWVTQPRNADGSQPDDQSEDHHYTVTVYDSNEDCSNVLQILNDFSEELSTNKAVRTGEMDVKVSVLNPGDSDGVIYRDATLKCGSDIVQVRATGNVDIKARSFAETTFSTRVQRLDSQSGDTDAYKRIAELIRKGEGVPIEITLMVSDRKLTGESTVR
jgi:hypothetical protein